jgi:hypothetical protein
MKRTLTILLLAAVMNGCAQFSLFKSAVAVEGARVADEALTVSEWGQCEAATVGAIKRRYKDNPEGLRRWQEFCSSTRFTPPAVGQ